MAFGVEELRVLRRALALAVHPSPASAEDVKDCLRLADSLDEAMREGVRLRAFLVADLARYRAALPGTAVGYLALLEEALGSGYRPVPDDLAALRALRGNPTAAALLTHCETLAEQDVRTRLAARTTHATRVARTAGAATPDAPADRPAQATFGPATPVIPPSRTRLLAIPGGLSESGRPRPPAGEPERTPQPSIAAGQDPAQAPAQKPGGKPAEKPAAPTPAPAPSPAEPDTGTPKPGRPIPTPGEVFPRRKPTPPPANPPQQLAAG
ncbi:hypothetical protein [Streptomyces sp. DH24]|uniref:hypothetical protein n=1 Tax=Streptomyces sp. DH24 TaxID=3040123 RepID=UPI002441AA9E|nr:hypothetical protein [Streptomyces sp. DH24]MDG9717508.1 hypothetical protein [Streptomyces sp. DH24]